jgi:streptogramin lyase
MELVRPLSLLRHRNGAKARGQRPRRTTSRVWLGFECLEGRCVPSTITELPPLPTPNVAPTGITMASDGSIWFTEMNANKLGRISPQGVLTEYTVPTANSQPDQITASSDGYVWFTEASGGKIGRISQTGGAIAEFALPGSRYFEEPTAITTRADGTVWFASHEQLGLGIGRIGQISSTGVITEVSTALFDGSITGIVDGPDGNLWVTLWNKSNGGSLAKVTTAAVGSFTEYKVSYYRASYSIPQGITVGPDNNLWFTEAGTNKIGRLTTSGVLSESVVPTASSQPLGITRGSGNTLWFTEQYGNRIGKITLDPVAPVTNLGVFRPSTGSWYLDTTNQSYAQNPVNPIPFGSPGDIPVVGDWRGSGHAEIGVFRPSTGQWFLDTTNQSYAQNPVAPIQLGNPGDTPVVGDWDGSGRTEIGVFRPSTGQWYLDTTNQSYAQNLAVPIPLGTTGDIPIVGNWQLSGTASSQAGAVSLVVAATGLTPNPSPPVIASALEEPGAPVVPMGSTNSRQLVGIQKPIVPTLTVPMAFRLSRGS